MPAVSPLPGCLAPQAGVEDGTGRRRLLLGVGLMGLAAADTLLRPEGSQAGLQSYNVTGQAIDEVRGVFQSSRGLFKCGQRKGSSHGNGGG